MEHSVTIVRDKRQLRLILLLLAVLTAVLAAVYFSFLKPDYAVLYTGLKPTDASAVVAELDAKGVAYQLRERGSTILVPQEEADAVRLAIVGSDVSTKGTSGFELFNKSDMGLTDFAQKINYQRALQGELARTIMMMEGIEGARVHLALPDKSLFRGNRSEPKAAVTIAIRNRGRIEESRVAGIQRLIAASVPDLSLSEVVVLDEQGRVIGGAASDLTLPPMVEEQTAVEQYYRARARAAVENTLPGLKFDIRIVVRPLDNGGELSPPRLAAAKSQRPGQARRDFRLGLSVVTPTELGPDERTLAANAIAAAVALDTAAGDTMHFVVAPLSPPPAAAAAGAAPGPAVVRSTVSEGPAVSGWPGWLPLSLALLLLGLALIAWRLNGRVPGLSTEDRDEFVSRLRKELCASEVGHDART